MTRLSLDIDRRLLQDELTRSIPRSGDESPLSLTAKLVAKQFRSRLDCHVASGEVLRYKVEFVRPQFTAKRIVLPLLALIEREVLELGYFLVTVVTRKDSPPIEFLPPTVLQWTTAPEIRLSILKTVCRYTVRMRETGLSPRVIAPVAREFASSCACPEDILLPHIDGVWDWALRFVCKVCGKAYFCECFKSALDKHYPKALAERSRYGEGGWPHKFIAAYKGSAFRDGICHLCKDLPSDLFYCHPMYGSKVKVHYGPYIVRTAIDKGVSEREAENEIRDILGIHRIGEGWISEAELLHIVQALYRGKEVLHQASPEWLDRRNCSDFRYKRGIARCDRQRLDIYVPHVKLAIEYQGRQHYEPVEFFGGQEGLRKTQERDRQKADLCRENGVRLVYFRYDEDVTRELVHVRIGKALVPLH